jgi:hypothetical protein
MTTTLIRGGTVVNADLTERADVLIKGRKIVAVGDKLSRTSRKFQTAPAASKSLFRCHEQRGVNTKRLTKEEFVARRPNAPLHQANAIWKGLTQPKGVERIEVTP